MGHSCTSKYNEAPNHTSCLLNWKYHSCIVPRDPPAPAHLKPGQVLGFRAMAICSSPPWTEGNGPFPPSLPVAQDCLRVLLEQGNTFSSWQSWQGIKSQHMGLCDTVHEREHLPRPGNAQAAGGGGFTSPPEMHPWNAAMARCPAGRARREDGTAHVVTKKKGKKICFG